MDAATRAAVTAAAVRAAKAVNYQGAGTIEFIADASEGLKADRIWFMEMNTRLQVEHPVTESVTGVDLVEWQFRVAAGEPIPLSQDEISLNGWAMEARLYAEDPANGFLPSIGRLEHFDLPADIRVDTGVLEGGEVSQFYDPMIAKLIVHAETREEAAAMLADAAGEVEVWPVKTNAAFLVRCLEHPRFVEGDVDTGFIAAEEADLAASPLSEVGVEDAAYHLRAGVPDASGDDADSPWDGFGGAVGLRLNAPPRLTQVLVVNGEARPARLLEGDELPVSRYLELSDTRGICFENGSAFEISAFPRPGAGSGPASDGALRAPMPGKIVAAPAMAGDAVPKGAPIVVLEAMKMEHALVAPFDGVVESVGVAVGEQVGEGTVLAVVRPVEA
jgi:acetyl/propionyl-CoA carboxylase alpha subunit